MSTEMEEPQHNLRDSPLPVDALAQGRSVLIRGPAMSGKYDLLLALLGALADDAMFVSTSRQVTGARRDFAAYGDPDGLAVVDCSSRVSGQETGGGDLVRYVSSPKNLTEIGVKFTELVESFETDGADAAVGIHSLSELLIYWDVDRVYQFLRVLLAECRDLDWPAAAVVDDDAAGEQAATTLTQPFDAVIATRADEDGRTFQYRESGSQPSDWTVF
ncbi:DUF7504 family protein [Halolamina salifodinae]|uniref:RecA-superfamily ATPase, KaiC/GvpD/RAD55 family n=1 Tax=Halolamina salifodinae TaxID=1202767 RepID=A0A8T4GVP1_9EURY|nr:hypothetical protein [Halolamina salifodinae]MBP1986133.1 hypothetical protein [Halolamina salifodinae]